MDAAAASPARGKCMRQECIYLITCELCQREGRQATIWEKLPEHLPSIRTMAKENPLVEQSMEEHLGQPPEFSMKILQTFKSSLVGWRISADAELCREGEPAQ